MELDNESGDKLACWHANFTSDSFMSLSRSVSGPMNLLFKTWDIECIWWWCPSWLAEIGFRCDELFVRNLGDSECTWWWCPSWLAEIDFRSDELVVRNLGDSKHGWWWCPPLLAETSLRSNEDV